MTSRKTVIVTGASQGIGEAIVSAFLDRDYNVVGNARNFSDETLVPSSNLAQSAMENFGSIDVVVSNAGIFSSKRFTDYTAEEFRTFIGAPRMAYRASNVRWF